MSLDRRVPEGSTPNEMPEGLLRQRRNLLITSLTIVVLHVGDFKFTQLNLLGMVAEIGNPEVIEQSLGLIWAYALLRYWQYYKDAELKFSMLWKDLFMHNAREVTGYGERRASIYGGCIAEKVEYSGNFFWCLTPIREEQEKRPTEDNQISLFKMTLIALFSLSDFLIESTSATDYLLPFVVAIVAASYVLFF